MTCKDCVHYGLCKYQSTLMVEDSCLAEQCADFKDRSRFIELPCELWDEVYMWAFGRNYHKEVIVGFIIDVYDPLKVVTQSGLELNAGRNANLFMTKEELLKGIQRRYPSATMDSLIDLKEQAALRKAKIKKETEQT